MSKHTPVPIHDALIAYASAKNAWRQSEGGTAETHALIATLVHVDRLDEAFADLLEAAREAERRIAALENADHITRMEWFESFGLDLCDALQDAIAKAEGRDA